MAQSMDEVRSIPIFLRKLWRMVNDPDASDVIEWNYEGDGFVIHNQIVFMTDYLPKYFKHNNLSSFVRQLNLYGFHKSVSLKDEIEFTHACFQRDNPSLLVLIKRKTTPKKVIDLKDPEHLQEIMDNVKEVKNKHNLVEKKLKNLRQENAALWGEISNLRLRHVKQSKIINKLIRFLLTYMHQSQDPRINPNINAVKDTPQQAHNQKSKTGAAIFELDADGCANEFWRKFDEDNQQGSSSNALDCAANYSQSKKSPFGPEIMEFDDEDYDEDDEFMDIGDYESIPLNVVSPKSEQGEDSATASQKPVEEFYYENGELKKKESQPEAAAAAGSDNTDNDHPIKNHLGQHIDNTQVELDNLQQLLSTLNNKELEAICQIYDKNIKEQEELANLNNEAAEALSIDLDPSNVNNPDGKLPDDSSQVQITDEFISELLNDTQK